MGNLRDGRQCFWEVSNDRVRHVMTWHHGESAVAVRDCGGGTQSLYAYSSARRHLLSESHYLVPTTFSISHRSDKVDYCAIIQCAIP